LARLPHGLLVMLLYLVPLPCPKEDPRIKRWPKVVSARSCDAVCQASSFLHCD
jgi:hypothetical protein